MEISKTTKRITIFTGLRILAVAVIYWAVQPSGPDFSVFEAGSERKQAFFGYFLPIIQQRNQEILETRQQLQEWEQDRDAISWSDALRIHGLGEDYSMDSFDSKRDAT